MKEYLINNIEMIIAFVTTIVTFLTGKICKKCMDKKYIPISNIIIMIVSTSIYWYATGNFSMVVASGSPVATLIYDTYHKIKESGDK